ncbi:MAG: SWIM zinc finger domain-containing protein [Candidatus Coproplasma sp.]
MDRSWKKLFEQKIRSRGKEYSYFCVSDYLNDENGYQATVKGTEYYKVVISSDYQNMSCTCPYAKDGKHCKHMAAVLYYAEAFEKQERERELRALEKAERQNKRNSVMEMQKLYGKRLHTSIIKEILPVSEWKRDINYLFNRHRNAYGFIGYWEADELIFKLLKYFDFLYSLISFCEDKRAIDASMWLYKKFHFEGVGDPSTDGAEHFENEMLSLWEELARYSDKNKQQLKTALTAYEFHYPAKEEMLERLTKE